MENLPESVQIGPYTYRIESFLHGFSDGAGDDYVNYKDMIINIAYDGSPQVQAVGLIRCICEIIFSMTGGSRESSIAESLKFAPHFASTLAASPEVMAWTMAALLEGREDREPREKTEEQTYTVKDDPSRSTIPVGEMDSCVPSVTPKGFYQDGFGQYWQRLTSKLGRDLMVPVIITANDSSPEDHIYRIPDSVSKFLDTMHITSREAIEQGLAHVQDGVLKLYSKA